MVLDCSTCAQWLIVVGVNLASNISCLLIWYKKLNLAAAELDPIQPQLVLGQYNF